MRDYRWTYEGPRIIEALVEIAFALACTFGFAWLGEHVFGWGEPSTWEWVIMYMTFYFTTNFRLR